MRRVAADNALRTAPDIFPLGILNRSLFSAQRMEFVKLQFVVPLAAPMEREARASPAQGEVAKICDFGRRGRKDLAIPQSKIK